MSRNSRAAFFVTFFSLASCKTNKNLTFLVATTVTTSLSVYIHRRIFSFLTRCVCWFTQCLSTQRSFGFVGYRYRGKVMVLIDKIKFRIIKSTLRSKKFLGNMTPHSFIHKKYFLGAIVQHVLLTSSTILYLPWPVALRSNLQTSHR